MLDNLEKPNSPREHMTYWNPSINIIHHFMGTKRPPKCQYLSSQCLMLECLRYYYNGQEFKSLEFFSRYVKYNCKDLFSVWVFFPQQSNHLHNIHFMFQLWHLFPSLLIQVLSYKVLKSSSIIVQIFRCTYIDNLS